MRPGGATDQEARRLPPPPRSCCAHWRCHHNRTAYAITAINHSRLGQQRPQGIGRVPAAVVTSEVNAHSLGETHGYHDLPALDLQWLRLDPARSLSHDLRSDGWVLRLQAPVVDLPAQFGGRKRNSVVLSCTCIGGGQTDPWTLPPTTAELKAYGRKPLRPPKAGAGAVARSGSSG